jgi:hypothetical protein
MGGWEYDGPDEPPVYHIATEVLFSASTPNKVVFEQIAAAVRHRHETDGEGWQSVQTPEITSGLFSVYVPSDGEIEAVRATLAALPALVPTVDRSQVLESISDGN